MLIFAAVFLIIAGILALLIYCKRDALRVSISIIECAGRFIQENFEVLFVPLVFLMITLIFFAGWLTVGVYLGGTGTIDQSS